ncbi:MAG TPA: tetratricopeptide repeat protein [Terriglobales bacterium]|nr:tetratricopeptide repeat protein [Terriglobales bacterium]
MDSASPFPWWRKDASIIAALIAVAAISFVLVFIYARTYQRREDSLSRSWYHRGNQALLSGNPKTAINDFRNALRYSPDNANFRLRLAQALAADDQSRQAIAYLLNLWESQPGNGLYNLELARVYSRVGDGRLASQHFNSAIYGAWDGNPAQNRRQSRLEFIHFLLANGSQTQAQAEAINLAAGVPPSDVAARFLAADVLLQTGENERAFDEYRSLMSVDAARASLGAGHSAFAVGHFRTASRYFQQAKDRGTTDPDVDSQLQMARLVLSSDPLQRRLSDRERARRVADAYETAGDRLQTCAGALNQQLQSTSPATEFQKLYADWTSLGPETGIRYLTRDIDARDEIMEIVGRIEEATAKTCGTPAGKDWALLMLSRYGEGVQR